VRIAAQRASNQFDTSRNAPPLIAAAHLEPNVMPTAQLEKVVGLKEHVREFGVRYAAVHATLHRILLQHVVHGEVLPDVAHELDRAQIRQPFGVVDHASRVRTRKIEKALQLSVDASGIFGDGLDRGKRTLVHFAGGVADEACPAADERDRTMPMSLEANEQHDDEQIADMETGRGGIEPDVPRDRSAVKQIGDLVGVLMQQAAPPEIVEECMRSHGTKLD
jgi:hypothetical protein